MAIISEGSATPTPELVEEISSPPHGPHPHPHPKPTTPILPIHQPPISTPLLPPPAFLLPSDAAAALAAVHGISLPSLLPLLVPPAAAVLPRAPISRFHVAAAGIGSSGRVYLGVNLEFPGVPLHHSVHAEQFLVSNASLHGERRLLHLAVSSVPCGHCRQFLHELRYPSDLHVLVTSDPSPSFRPISDLLPRPFVPHDLLPPHSPLLLDPSPFRHLLLLDGPSVDGLAGRVREAALDGARRSHAPYSDCPAGFAVGDIDGKVYGGGAYMESAAYNPSFGPAQAGLVAYVAGGGGEYARLTEAALVEREGAAVSHVETARLLMEKIAPTCRIRVYRCCLAEEVGDV